MPRAARRPERATRRELRARGPPLADRRSRPVGRPGKGARCGAAPPRLPADPGRRPTTAAGEEQPPLPDLGPLRAADREREGRDLHRCAPCGGAPPPRPRRLRAPRAHVLWPGIRRRPAGPELGSDRQRPPVPAGSHGVRGGLRGGLRAPPPGYGGSPGEGAALPHASLPAPGSAARRRFAPALPAGNRGLPAAGTDAGDGASPGQYVDRAFRRVGISVGPFRISTRPCSGSSPPANRAWRSPRRTIWSST